MINSKFERTQRWNGSRHGHFDESNFSHFLSASTSFPQVDVLALLLRFLSRKKAYASKHFLLRRVGPRLCRLERHRQTFLRAPRSQTACGMTPEEIEET